MPNLTLMKDNIINKLALFFLLIEIVLENIYIHNLEACPVKQKKKEPVTLQKKHKLLPELGYKPEALEKLVTESILLLPLQKRNNSALLRFRD